MTTTSFRGDPELSIVVPVGHRAGDLAALHRETAAELARLGRRFEFLFVVDARRRDVLPALRRLQQEAEHEVVIVVMGGAFGESASLSMGFERAHGETVITLPAYFQVEPSGLGALLAALEAGADLAVARREPRVDSWWNRVQSRLFHGFVRRLTSTDFRDVACGVRAMRRRVARELNLYGGMHRFIPVLALARGFSVREVPIPQRREDAPSRYHRPGVYIGRLLDVLTIFFLVKFTRTPLRFFGPVGMGLFSVGFLIDLVVAAQKLFLERGLSDRPLLLLGVLLMILGVQTLSIGLLGEIIIFTHARNVRDYQVAEVLRSPGRLAAARDRRAS
ncbi:MAG TPA: glycosyltransferase [Thermoanaerobaculia bacterium]|nr:glycosyltransferase [Thermoanaerobaculia bacterium]